MAANHNTSSVTSSRERVVEAICDLLPEVLGSELGGVTEETKLFDQLGLDSTGVLDLMLKLEDSLGVEFDTDNLHLNHFESVGTLTDYVLAETGD
jgi:acyl carrier protein